MPSTVTTSIVVQFTKGEADGVMIAEVDDREVSAGGLNGGRTSFLPGDTVRLLLYKGALVIIDHVEASLGALTVGSLVTIQKTEDISFAGETEASLRYPVTGSFAYQWLGKNNGVVSVVGETGLRIPEPAAGQHVVGIARVTYNTQARVYTLNHSDLGLSEYGVMAYFVGHTV